MKIEGKKLFDLINSFSLKLLGFPIKNDTIFYFNSLDNIQSNSVIWVKNIVGYNEKSLEDYENLVIITNQFLNNSSKHSYVIVDNPRNTYFSLLDESIKLNYSIKDDFNNNLMYKHTDDSISQNVRIGDFCKLSNNIIFGSNVVVEDRVSLYGSVVIGDNVCIGSGSVIGREGYGYFYDFHGKQKKIPHIGSVTIGDNVDIGANTVIDRATLGETVIEENCKINNLCHIGHNVRISKGVLVGVGSIISGSTVIGENVYIAPGAIIRNKISIGDNSFIGMGAVVTKNVDENLVVVGNPAKPMNKGGKVKFTYDDYRNLINKIKEANYKICDFNTYSNEEKSVILRHDIDFSLDKALEIAILENNINVSSTFFFLLTSNFYNIFSKEAQSAIKEIVKLGHNIGLHFDETVYKENVTERKFIYNILKEVDLINDFYRIKIDVVSFHRPSQAFLDSSLQIDGLINTYDKDYFKNISYVSDSRMRWRTDILDLINNEVKYIQFLTHPFWYFEKERSLKDIISDFINKGNYDRYLNFNDNFTNLSDAIVINELKFDL